MDDNILLKISSLISFLNQRGYQKEGELILRLQKEAASKKKVLVDKLGLSEDLAEKIDDLFKGISIFIVNKIIEDVIKNPLGLIFREPIDNKEKAVKYLNQLGLRNINNFYNLYSIKDYFQVHLGGNIESVKDLTIRQIKRKAEEWHNNLVGSGQINYIEKNPIIIDMRDSDGMGFYWADLETSSSKEEGDRSGHCGTGNRGDNLYSLRSYSRIAGTKYTINNSHLTVSINSNGIVSQFKGPKNSKPEPKMHPYIMELYKYIKPDLDPLITGYRGSYKPETDFKIWDLNREDFEELYNKRPHLFSSFASQIKLMERGIISHVNFDFNFILTGSNDSLEKLLTEYDRDFSIKGLIKVMDNGGFDPWDFEHDSKYWIEYLKGYGSAEANEVLNTYLNNKIEELAPEDSERLKKLDLINKIKEVENITGERKISMAITRASEDAAVSQADENLYENVKSCLSNYGEILDFSFQEGFKIKIDLFKILKSDEIIKISEEIEIELIPDAKGKFDNKILEEIFETALMEGYIGKEVLRVNLDWGPIRTDVFSERLEEVLNEDW